MDAFYTIEKAAARVANLVDYGTIKFKTSTGTVTAYESANSVWRFLLKVQTSKRAQHPIIWVLQNPSIVRKDNNPVLNKVVKFSHDLGAGLIYIVNTIPWTAPHLVGPYQWDEADELNNPIVECAVESGIDCVYAWGNLGACLNDELASTLLANKMDAYVFGFTKQKQPKHPGHLSFDSQLYKRFSGVNRVQ